MRQVSITGLLAHRHDLRHPDGRHRPVDRLAARLRRAGGRRRRQGRPVGPLHRRRRRRSAMAGSWPRLRRSPSASPAASCRASAITKLKVPPFVVTLGGMSVFRGAALLFAAGGPISGFDAGYAWWGQGKIGPVPVPVIIFLICAVAAHIVLTLHALRPAGLCRRRQSGGGAPVRPQRQPDHRQRLCHHGLLRRPLRLRAVGPAQLRRGRRRHRLRTDRHRLGGHRRHQPVRRHRHDLRHRRSARC